MTQRPASVYFHANVTEEKPLREVGHVWHTYIINRSSPLLETPKRNKVLIF